MCQCVALALVVEVEEVLGIVVSSQPYLGYCSRQQVTTFVIGLAV